MGESQMREMAREQNEGTTLEEYQRRLASVEQVMTKRGIDCILINASHSIKYLTGADNTCSWVFITRKGRRVAIVLESDYNYYRTQSVLDDIRKFRPHDPVGLFRALRDELGLRQNSMALEREHLRALTFDWVASCFGDAVNRDDWNICAELIVEEARAVKTAEELSKVRKAAELAAFGIQVARDNAIKSTTETELARCIYNNLFAKGAGPETFLYVGSDARSALAHNLPRQNKLVNGPVVVDIHVCYQDFFADMARTIFLDDADQEQSDAYNYLRESIALASSAVRADASLDDIRKAFYSRLKRMPEGWVPLFGPVIHGCGVSNREMPRFRHPWEGPGYPEKLESNMTAAVSNIGLYSNRGWGVRWEDTLVVTGGEPEVLTRESRFSA